MRAEVRGSHPEISGVGDGKARMSGMSDQAVIAATGRDWSAWRIYVDACDARDKSHKEIARELSAAGVPGWWAQMVTVEYERMIGRRAVGQRCGGA